MKQEREREEVKMKGLTETRIGFIYEHLNMALKAREMYFSWKSIFGEDDGDAHDIRDQIIKLAHKGLDDLGQTLWELYDDWSGRHDIVRENYASYDDWCIAEEIHDEEHGLWDENRRIEYIVLVENDEIFSKCSTLPKDFVRELNVALGKEIFSLDDSEDMGIL